MGTRATIPDIPGLAGARPTTHVEALELDRSPEHLIVLGGGYVGLELAQAMRRFGSRVTVVEMGPRPAGREDADVGASLLELFHDEGIQVLLGAEVRRVEGRSGAEIRVSVEDAGGERVIEATDFLRRAYRTLGRRRHEGDARARRVAKEGRFMSQRVLIKAGAHGIRPVARTG